MDAWGITKYGSNSVVQLMDLPEPTVGDDEVLIEVKAASINPVDFKIRNGDLKAVLPYKFPLIMGNDCSGVVVRVGKGVTKFGIGDEVYTRPHKERVGTLAKLTTAKESAVALKPKNLSFEEAASLPLAGLTSWQAIVEELELKAGQRIFIPAGSGGVGTFAIQLAKAIGAYVITNTSSKNVEFVKSLGADEVIDYQTQDFSQEVSAIDAVFDTMGGETQKKAFKILKPGGSLISIVGPPTAEFARKQGLGKGLQLGSALMSFATNQRARRSQCHYKFLFMHPDGVALQSIAKLVESGLIKPVIDQTFPFKNAKDAIAHVEKGHSRGKVVVSGP